MDNDLCIKQPAGIVPPNDVTDHSQCSAVGHFPVDVKVCIHLFFYFVT